MGLRRNSGEMMDEQKTAVQAAVHVDGAVVECQQPGGSHFHAEVRFMGQGSVLSPACNSEDEAGAVLEFAKDVIRSMTAAMGGKSVLTDATAAVQ